MLQQFAAQLTYAEKVSLLSDLKAMIAAELMDDPEDPAVCPHCGCPTFIRKGHERSGGQRWLCRGCARTFSGSTKGLLANSKLDRAVWMAFAECMADALSLRESALRCGVALSTAWFMRHRVCEAIQTRLVPFRTEGRCQIDATHFTESFSGNHTKSGFKMPRKTHKNGQSVHKRGISNEQVYVMTGINELGDCFCELVDRGMETIEEVKGCLSGRIGEQTQVISDMHRSYPKAIAALGAASHVTVDPKDRSTGDINMVNSLHSRLQKFIRTFNGVATRRLQHYLDWFCYREQFKNSDADKRETLFRHEAEGTYETTRREYAQTPHPFMGYWDGATSTVV